MNDPMKHARLATALDMLRNSEGYKKGTPQQQETLEKIVRDAARSPDQAVASAMAVVLSGPLRTYYSAHHEVISDMIAAALNAFKGAVIADTLMQLWPDPNDAPDEAIAMGLEVAGIYRTNLAAFKNLSDAVVASRRNKEPQS